jgi:hypothetical protein
MRPRSRPAQLALALRNAPRHFEEMNGEPSEGHPVDLAVARAPAVRTAQERVRRQRQTLAQTGISSHVLIPALDAETELRRIREGYYFHAGFALGGVAARAQARLHSPQARQLAKRLWATVLAAEIPWSQAVTIMIESTRAVVLSRLTARSRRR